MGIFDFLRKKRNERPVEVEGNLKHEDIDELLDGEVAESTLPDGETGDMGFGAQKSPKDARDVPYEVLVGTAGAAPKTFFVDVSKLPTEYQKKNGSCVGHAAQKYKQLLDLLETGKVIKLSPRFLYALAKCRDGALGEGTYPRLVAKILKDVGCALTDTVPNDCDLEHEKYVYNRKESDIPAAAFEQAKPYKIGGFAFPNVKNAFELKTAIIRDGGAILLARIGKEWWTKANGEKSWNKKDIVPLRAPKNIVSGHEIYLYGYTDVVENGVERTKFYIMNSWSLDWGDKGKAWFYHDEYSKFLDEAITFTDLPNKIVKALKTMPRAEEFVHVFYNDLKLGDKGDEVAAMQTFLMFMGYFSREMYAELLKKDELGYYGLVTQTAVLLFQLSKNVGTLKELCDLEGTLFGTKSRVVANDIIHSGGHINK